MENLSLLRLPYEAYQYTKRKLTADSERYLKSVNELGDMWYPVQALSFSPDGSLLSFSSHDGSLWLWDTDNCKVKERLFKSGSPLLSSCFSSDGRLLAIGSRDGTVYLLDVETNSGVAREKFTSTGGRVDSVCFSPDGHLLASGHANHNVCLWDVSSLELIGVLTGHEDRVTSVRFSPDGDLLFSGSPDGYVCTWNVGTSAIVDRLSVHRGRALSVQFSPDGRMLAYITPDGKAKLWDIRSKTQIHKMIDHGRGVLSVCFSPDTRLLACGTRDGSLRFFDTANGEKLFESGGRGGWVCSVSFSPDGSTLAYGSTDGIVRLVRLEPYTLLGKLPTQNSRGSAYRPPVLPPVLPLEVDTRSYETTIVEEVESYGTLLDLVAQIAALNPQYQLFFRGQTNNWLKDDLDTKLYTGVWREPLSAKTLAERREILNSRSDDLQKAYGAYFADDPTTELFLDRMKQNPLIRWALLQHYGVCETPLLDVTRSLQVACTFARMGAKKGHGYVYVLGVPYQREAVSIDDREGMTVMSLLGVTPSSARRPLNQDGFFVSTSEWWRYEASDRAGDAPRTAQRPNYYSRVITVFRIPTGDGFYVGSGFADFRREWLCPPEDDDEFARMLKENGLEPKFW